MGRPEPQEWRQEDLCSALELRNQLPKDAARRKTPRWEVFSGRSPIGAQERAAFQARLKESRAGGGITGLMGIPITY